MFPIPSERKLSVGKIAEYWSRGISPPASPQELREVISKAWWRGELIATNAPSRLSVLRGYYLRSADFIAFAIPDIEEPLQWRSVEHDTIEFVRPLRAPLPNADSDTWTDANCAPTFEAIAEQCNEAVISPSEPTLLGIVLTSSEFFQWIDACGYKPPTFWSNALENSDQPKPTHSTAPRIDATKDEIKTAIAGVAEMPMATVTSSDLGATTSSSNPPLRKRSKPVRYHIGRAVEALAKQYGGKFPPDGTPVKERDRLIVQWLQGDDADDHPPVKPSKRSLRYYFNEHKAR